MRAYHQSVNTLEETNIKKKNAGIFLSHLPFIYFYECIVF